MKSKQLLILCIVAVALLAAGIVMNRSKSRSWQGQSTGGKVLPTLDAAKVGKFVVQNAKGTVTVEFKDDLWRVAERYGYPAKFETLATFLEDLAALTVTQRVAAGESQYGRLKLNDPGQDDAGSLLTVFGQDGSETAALIFGKEHLRKGNDSDPMGRGGFADGRYLRTKGGTDVILVAKSFSQIDDQPNSWLDDQFFKLSDIQEASLSAGGEILWTASRADKSAELQLAGEVPEGKEVDATKLGGIKNAFSWARCSDVADPALEPEDTGFDQAKTFVAKQFDGTAYTVTVGKKGADGKYYLAVKADYAGPTERVAAEGEKPEDKETLDKAFAATLAEVQKKVADLNARTQNWVYLVDAWTVESVTKSRDELLKDKPKPKEEAATPPAGAVEGAAAQE